MKIAEGLGAWHNNYNTRPLAECVERAERARLDFVIVKYGWPHVERAYQEAGIPWATERYVFIDQPENEGNMLADAVDAGACFAVINAEEGRGGWGRAEEGAQAIETIATTFCARHPAVALYACLDTRGDRLRHPYQQAALHWCDGIMPMIYPGAFRPHQPGGYIGQAFDDALAGKDFGDQRVYPVLQSYGWEWPKDSGQIHHMGPAGIAVQAEYAKDWRMHGMQFYTIHHATDEEWDAVCALKLKPEPEPDPLTAKEKCELAIYRGSKPLIHLATDGEWAALHAKLHEMKVDA